MISAEVRLTECISISAVVLGDEAVEMIGHCICSGVVSLFRLN